MRKGWLSYRFDEVFDLQMGKTPDRKSLHYYGGDNVWVSIRDMISKEITDSSEHITDEAIKDTNIRKVKRNTVIMSFKLTVGKCGIAAKDLYTNEAIMAFNLREGFSVDSSFLYYYLQGYQWDGANKAVMGITLNKATISRQLMEIPPLSIQQSIVAELDKINELISLKKSQMNDLDALAQSIFYDMFGDPVENEKGWEVKPWKQLLETKLGKMLDKAKQDVNAKSFPYLANLNVQWGYFDLSDIRTMPFSEQEIEKFRLKDGDLMICEGGESGRCAIWKATDNDMFFQKAVHRARVIDKSTTNIVYIRYLLEYTKKGDGLKDYITKSTIEHLTGEKLNKLPIPLPPLPLQQSFAAKIEAIERQKQQVKQSLKDLETLLASRMQYWFEEE